MIFGLGCDLLYLSLQLLMTVLDDREAVISVDELLNSR